jgi:putative hydrolase of the HAD superfamily
MSDNRFDRICQDPNRELSSERREFCYNLPVPTILFDYGGTLDADGTPWLDRFYPIYKDCGVDIPRTRFDRAFYDSDDGLPARHSLSGLNLEQTLLLQVRDVLAAAAPESLGLADGIAARFAEDSRRHFRRLLPTLERLSRTSRLGIVSNFYGNLDDILRAEGLRGLFGAVADSGTLGVTKPDARIFLHAAQALESGPQDCVMVGDSVARDVKGAAAAGMKTALVCAQDKAPEAGQDWTLRSVADLEAALG